MKNVPGLLREDGGLSGANQGWGSGDAGGEQRQEDGGAVGMREWRRDEEAASQEESGIGKRKLIGRRELIRREEAWRKTVAARAKPDKRCSWAFAGWL